MNAIMGMMGIVASLWVADYVGRVWGEPALAAIAIFIALLLIPLSLQSLQEDVQQIFGRNLFGKKPKGKL